MNSIPRDSDGIAFEDYRRDDEAPFTIVRGAEVPKEPDRSLEEAARRRAEISRILQGSPRADGFSGIIAG